MSEDEEVLPKKSAEEIKEPKDPQEEEGKRSDALIANDMTTQSASPSYVVPEALPKRRRDIKALNKQQLESLCNRDSQFKMPGKNCVVSEKEVQESLMHFFEVKNEQLNVQEAIVMTHFAAGDPLKVRYQEEFFKTFPFLDRDAFCFVKIQFEQLFKVLVMGLKKELN